MPHQIAFDASRKRITVVVAPPIHQDEALACFREVRTHPEFREEYGILFNLLAADRDLPYGETIELGEVVKAFFPNQRIGIVVASANSEEDTVKFFQAAVSGKAEVRIFTEMGDADSWLGS